MKKETILNLIKEDEKLNGELIFLIANAIQAYDEITYDECEGHYTSFANEFVNKRQEKLI